MTQITGTTAQPTQLPTRFPFWAHALLIGYTFTLLAVGLSFERALTYHEVVYAEPAREMLATGDWLVPRIAGVPFCDKPALTAWTIALSMWVFGSDAEWVVRLPSILAAVFIAWMIGVTAARWFGVRVGLAAGMMLTTAYFLLQVAILADSDIRLIAAVTAALCLFAWYHIDAPAGRCQSWWVPPAFFLAAALSFLTKGPIGSVFIFSATGLFLIVQRDFKGFRFFFNPMGLAVYLLCIVPYVVLAFQQYPQTLDGWLLNNVGRFRGDLGGGVGGQQSPFFYFYIIPMVLLPWLPLVLAGFLGKEGLWKQPLGRFLACWLLPGFVLLCLSSFKVKHYAHPLLPGLMIPAALGFWRFLEWRKATKNLRTGAWLTTVLLGCGAGLTAVLILQPTGTPAIVGLVLAALIGFCGVLVLETHRRENLNATAILALAWVFVAGVFQLVMPKYDSYRPQTEFAHTVNQLVPRGQPIHLVALPDNQITFYLDTIPKRTDCGGTFLLHHEKHATGPVHVLTNLRVGEVLKTNGHATELARFPDNLLRYQTEEDRLVLLRWERN